MGKNVVIIGGAAGGPSAAAEAKRQDPSLSIRIIEQGEHVSFAA
jgi:2-polyprenyl-6-methoxyphenol hydroxylase-like FAD-dependent oxidoreductase